VPIIKPLLAKILFEVNSRVKQVFDLLWLAINKGANIKDTIVISGAPRSGTTWIMEILETLPGYKSIFEPLHRRWFPEVKRFNLFPLYRPYLHPKDSNPALKRYLEKVFSGYVISRRPYFPLTLRNLYKRLFADKILIKFIHANRILPWIAYNFKLRAIYWVMRHPCATISSQLETGVNNLHDIKSTDQLIKEALSIPELKGNEELVERLKTIEKPEEILAVIWSVDTYVPMCYQRCNWWYTLIYEKLIVDDEEELGKIFRYIGENVPEEAYKKLRTPSITGRGRALPGSKRNLRNGRRNFQRDR